MGGRRTLDQKTVARRERRGNTGSARSRAANEPRNPKPRSGRTKSGGTEGMMDGVIAAAALVATAVLLGSMAFFSAVMAPLVFTKLGAGTAGR